MKPSLITIKETKQFSKLFDKLVGKEERLSLHHHLADHPESGVLLVHGHGLRKLRWARPGRGKSGGVRIVYYYWRQDAPVYLLTVFAKNEKDNLTARELKEFALLAEALRKQQEGR